jgi:hypothetical protein
MEMENKIYGGPLKEKFDSVVLNAHHKVTTAQKNSTTLSSLLMNKKKHKWYVVLRGNRPGVYRMRDNAEERAGSHDQPIIKRYTVFNMGRQALRVYFHLHESESESFGEKSSASSQLSELGSRGESNE